MNAAIRKSLHSELMCPLKFSLSHEKQFEKVYKYISITEKCSAPLEYIIRRVQGMKNGVQRILKLEFNVLLSFQHLGKYLFKQSMFLPFM